MRNSVVKPLVSVIVPGRGQLTTLEPCLRTLVEQKTTFIYEIIAVVSEVPPLVIEMINRFPQIRLVHSVTGLMSGTARNLGAQHAHGDYLVFTDADCLPKSDFLQCAFDGMETNVRLIGGAIEDGLPFHPISVSDNILQFTDFPKSRPAGNTPYVPSTGIAIRRHDFLTAGGFPDTDKENMQCSDIGFCENLQKLWPSCIRFIPRMQVRHIGRTSIATYWKHQYHFGFSRGLLGLQLKPLYQRLGQYKIMILPVVIKRWIYLAKRTLRWNSSMIFRFIILSPLILVGLIGWSLGFNRGCCEALKEKPC